MERELVLSALLISFSALLGMIISKNFKLRADTLKKLISSLCEMENYIVSGKVPLPQIYEKLSDNSHVGKFFKKLSLSGTSNTHFLWEENLPMLPVNSDDLIPLKELAKSLGAGGVTHQKTAIELCKTGLLKRLSEAETAYEKDGKLYRKLGLYAGILLAIFKVG